MNVIYRKKDSNNVISSNNYNFAFSKEKYCKFIDEINKEEFFLRIKQVPYSEECYNCFFLKYREKYETHCKVQCIDSFEYIENGLGSILFEEMDYYEGLFIDK